MNCVIRKAAKGDADALFELVRHFATSFQPDREAFNACMDIVIADESAWLSLAVNGGEVIGYCLGFDHRTFYANGRVSWVEDITVKAEARRKGVGRALMAAFEGWARSRESKLIGLATRRAAAFYTALGYDNSATFFRKLL